MAYIVIDTEKDQVGFVRTNPGYLSGGTYINPSVTMFWYGDEEKERVVSDIQGWVDATGRARGAAAVAQDAAHRSLVALAKHLRHDHGWGRRRLAAHLGVSERWVKENVDA